MPGKRRPINVEIRVGQRLKELRYRRFRWYLYRPDFQRYLL